MNRSSNVIELCNILVDTFDNFGKEDTPNNYTAFVQVFAREHGMQIYGELIHADDGGWKTTGYRFDDEAAEVFFKLKFGMVVA